MMDVNTVFLKNMPFILAGPPDAWNRGDKTQPANITLRVNQVKSINDAAATDDISKSLDYGKLYKTIQSELDNISGFAGLANIARQVLASVKSPWTNCFVEVDLPKAALRAEGGLKFTVDRDNDVGHINDYETLHIRDIKCACIIGVNPHERREKQPVIVNLVFEGDTRSLAGWKIGDDIIPATFTATNEYHKIIAMVVNVCQLLYTATFHYYFPCANSLLLPAVVKLCLSYTNVSFTRRREFPPPVLAGSPFSGRKLFFGVEHTFAVPAGRVVP